MKLLCPLAALAVCVCPVAAGDIQGHALITKRLTKKGLAPVVYNLRGPAPHLTAADGDAKANEFDRMVVFLEGGSLPPKTPVTATIEQLDSHFDPELIVVPTGSTVQFPNSDPIFHNVFSLSKAQSFDLGFYSQGQSRTVKFNRAGVVQVYCHIHTNMYAAIVVTSSPWFAKPSSDGSFEWSDVPAGHYRLTAWHKIAGFHQTEVDVPESGKAKVTIRVPIDPELRP